MTHPEACPFCHCAAERIIARSALALALWDGHPVSPGHALIVPARHVPTWFEATLEERGEIVGLLDSVRDVVTRQFGADGWNIGMNLGTAAGQTVPHLHVHVIPRHAGDVPDPRGGVRWVVPEKADYWSAK